MLTGRLGAFYADDNSRWHVAYFGTYSVDSAAQLVTQRIEGELLSRLGSVEVATPYRLHGDSLILGTDSLEQWIFVRVQ